MQIHGGLISVALLAPNALLLLFPPRTLPPTPPEGSATAPPAWMRIAEGAGRAGVLVIPFFHTFDTALPGAAIALAVMLAALGLSWTCLARYLLRGRDYRLFFAPLGGLPFPMAVLPLPYFLAASFPLSSPQLALAAVVFAVGHVGVSLQTRNQFGSALKK